MSEHNEKDIKVVGLWDEQITDNALGLLKKAYPRDAITSQASFTLHGSICAIVKLSAHFREPREEENPPFLVLSH